MSSLELERDISRRKFAVLHKHLFLQNVLEEIYKEGYSTVSEVLGSLHNHCERLANETIALDEEKFGLKYEQDARADAFTDGEL
tara:strand:+ start:661 stop:912 length:252 start_codon:yes stop_codon:yes gene_type:complete